MKFRSTILALVVCAPALRAETNALTELRQLSESQGSALVISRRLSMGGKNLLLTESVSHLAVGQTITLKAAVPLESDEGAELLKQLGPLNRLNFSIVGYKAFQASTFSHGRILRYKKFEPGSNLGGLDSWQTVVSKEPVSEGDPYSAYLITTHPHWSRFSNPEGRTILEKEGGDLVELTFHSTKLYLRGQFIVSEIWQRNGHFFSKVDNCFESGDYWRNLLRGLPDQSELVTNIGRTAIAPKEVLGFSLKKCSDGFEVTHVIEGGPAAAAGLKVGDVLTSVESRKTAGMPIKDVMPLLNRRGRKVHFVVQRQYERLHVHIIPGSL